MANVLIIGNRKKCYRAALGLGHRVFLWSDGSIHESRKRKLAGWIESPFEMSEFHLDKSVAAKVADFEIDFVVAATEASVDLAARIRRDLKLPGTPIEVSNLLHNKFKMKKAARSHKIPITHFHLISDEDTPEDLVCKLGLPLVIKPVAESGARGVVVIKDINQLQEHMKAGLLAESFVKGREISVETLIYEGKLIFHNITDYLHQWRKSIMPANLPESLEQQILKINDRVIQSFGVENGMTHSEFYITESGPVFGEMAVRPPGGYYMNLNEEAYGFDPWAAYVQIECGGERPTVIEEPTKFAAVVVFHPGQGTVSQILGVEEARKVSENFEFKFRLKVGDTVSEHLSTSSECGHVLMSSECETALIEKIDFIEKTIKIQLEAIS